MRFVFPLTLLASCMLFTTPTLAKDSPEESAIKTRQGSMEIQAYSLGPLVAMIKGDREYDAELAQTMANNLQTLQEVDISGAWMMGTSTNDFDETRALPDIWENPEDLGEKGKKSADAISELVEVAGDGVNQMAPKVKNVADTCKSCHDDYRAEE